MEYKRATRKYHHTLHTPAAPQIRHRNALEIQDIDSFCIFGFYSFPFPPYFVKLRVGRGFHVLDTLRVVGESANA